MDTGASWWRRNSPAGDGEAAYVFPSPLDWCSSSSTPPTQMAFEDYSEYEDYYRFEIQGPRDERDLGECFGSPFSPFTNVEVNLTHEALRDEKEGKEEEDEEKEERREGEGSTTWPLHCRWRRKPAPAATPREEGRNTSSIVGLLDNIPKSGSGPRRPRQKGKWWPHHFGDLCSSSKVEKPGQRKNNEHWTPEEVKLLVDGIFELGVGHWSELKRRLFSDSFRTAENLKDKWRNLREAYTAGRTSKKKVNAPLDKKLIQRIRRLAADNPHPK